MSPTAGRAVALKFKEASANDGRRLTSPYFRFDENISGQVLISNLGSSGIKVGARMVFANSTARPVKTATVTIPAGGMASIDLSSAGDAVPNDVIATGRVDLIHSGPAGTVTAAVTESGCHNSAQVVPLDGGVPLDPVTLFPVGAVVIPGGCTITDVITDGTVTNPTITDPGACFGTLIQTFASGPNTFQTTMCVPTSCVGDVPLIYTPPGGGAGDESDFTVVQMGASGFSTSLGTRLNPNGTTQFTLTANNPFPSALLQVEFSGKRDSVFTQVQGNGVSASVTSTGPVNHTFLGNVKRIFVRQLNADGTLNTSVPLVLKAKNTGAYFALDRPTSITAINPGAVPVTGGTVTITGTGFQTWDLGTVPNVVTVNPTVEVGTSSSHDQIPFTLITTTTDQTTIRGNVGPTPSTAGTCAEAGRTPCKTITVINPGGSDGVDDLTSQDLLTINAPSVPVITGTAALTVTGQQGPATSNSLGVQDIRRIGNFTAASPVSARIFGRNLNRVRTVTFVGAAPIVIGPSNINSDGTRIELGVPTFCLTAVSNTVAIAVDDGVNPLVSFANGWTYTPTDPIQVFLPNVPFQAAAFLAGPCENITINLVLAQPGNFAPLSCNSQVPSCVRIANPTTTQRGIASVVFPNANIAVLTWTSDCSACFQTGRHDVSFFALVTNSRSGSQVNACVPASCFR